MPADEITKPNPLPRAITAGGNGAVGAAAPSAVPEEHEWEDTGERYSAALSAIDRPDLGAVISESIKSGVEKAFGGGGPPSGGVPPEVHKKSIKRHNWIAVIMATLLGPGGAIAVIYATSDRSKANEMKVNHVEQKVEEDLKPRVEKVEKAVEGVQKEVSKVTPQITDMQVQQTTIYEGIEELKKENVKRLKDELDDARRENRRLRRRPR